LFHNNATNNTGIGTQALYTNFSGQDNTGTGVNSLYTNYSGNGNTATGVSALVSNSFGNYNTANGLQALFNNTGSDNTATGTNALYFNTTGNKNTTAGNYALQHNTGGNNNTAVGYGAGSFYNYTNSTFIGYYATSALGNLDNVTVVGNGASATASNQVRIGNSSVTSIGGKVGWSTLSDARFKKNISEDVPGLSFINKLRPVSYTLDIEKLDKASGITDQSSPEEANAKMMATKERHTGFVAQEVEKVVAELNYEFGGIDKPKNGKDYYGLRYAEFVVPLVKAVQELNKENEDFKNRNDKLEARIEKLEALLTKTDANTTVNVSGAYLKQNAPNPAAGATIIGYRIPEGATSVKFTLTNSQGQLVKR
jgi:hypothetical protein